MCSWLNVSQHECYSCHVDMILKHKVLPKSIRICLPKKLSLYCETCHSNNSFTVPPQNSLLGFSTISVHFL